VPATSPSRGLSSADPHVRRRPVSYVAPMISSAPNDPLHGSLQRQSNHQLRISGDGQDINEVVPQLARWGGRKE
jgi:hypothetical protein